MPAGSPNRAVPLCILVIDIAGFSRRDWLDPTRASVRRELDKLVKPALEPIEVGPEGTTYSNTGDGLLCLVDARHRGDVIDATAELERRLSERNRRRGRQEQIRLRVVAHFGDVIRDGNATGDALNFAFRLLDSAKLRARLASVRRDLVLMVSEQIYSQVIATGNCSRYAASDFEQVTVKNKGLRAKAWVFRRETSPSGFEEALAALGERVWEVGARAGGLTVGLLRRRVWRVPLGLVLFPFLALTLAVAPLVTRSEADACPVPAELPLLTSTTNEALMRQLGGLFTDDLRRPGDRCRLANVTVFSVPSSSDVVDAVATGWPVDSVTRHGAEPSVWIPDSSAEVNRVNERLGRTLTKLGSIATSPVVLAMRQADVGMVGRTRSLTWSAISRVGRPPEGPRVRVARADPTSTAAALLGTIGLYTTADDASGRRAIEQMLVPVVGGDETGAVCAMGQVGADGDEPPGAVITPEHLVVARSRGRLGGSCGGRTDREGDRLDAVYPSDPTPFLDYPYVLLEAAFEDDEREALWRQFFTFLQSDPEARKAMCEAGLRDPDRRVCGTIGVQDGVLPFTPLTPLLAPDGGTVEGRLGQWGAARRAAWALLVLDVSGSMRSPLPGQPGGDRMSAAREAAENAVQLMGSRDHIGLWQFSTRLEGSRDHRELVPLGPVETQREPVRNALRGMRATTGDTGLYDTIIAGVANLRDEGGGGDDANALVVVTDGENDDPSSVTTVDDVIDQLIGGRPVHVFLLTFGSAACGSRELTTLTSRTETVCLDADESGLDRAFEQVSATLWGTDSP
jgi:Ca-activated chloride channel family protein